ncbi:MAG TPA: ATP-binding cassette domain-containing protein [Candidatus Wallbacteria bacterium]|nr:MAG: Spermidine/putrescine import ATP-binding protein PotA [bacterium ADurb.Bin243]HOD39359.1 ATP-binding cassette domain-containing protein [Candidatus Wallbacteria bacterium]HPG58284.1 ATP-binding cassette domain-containing protein [Candidatus Wallbacteria bacterium]
MLELKCLHKTFNPGTPDEVKALSGVSLTIADGSFTVILGTNGSGKSTLLNAVAGTFIVDSGSIVLNGTDLTHLPEHRRASHIGRVFQNPFSGTAPNMTIAENLAIASMRGKKRRFLTALSRGAMREFYDRVKSLNMGLEDRLDNNIGSLSGGQRQALTLLMACWNRPDLLLLDEHTAALDPKTAAKVLELTKNYIEKDGLTAFMVTHSMQQAVNMGERIIMVYKGKIIHDFSGADKKSLKAKDLYELFEDIKRRELIDPAASEILKANYV